MNSWYITPNQYTRLLSGIYLQLVYRTRCVLKLSQGIYQECSCNNQYKQLVYILPDWFLSQDSLALDSWYITPNQYTLPQSGIYLQLVYHTVLQLKTVTGHLSGMQLLHSMQIAGIYHTRLVLVTGQLVFRQLVHHTKQVLVTVHPPGIQLSAVNNWYSTANGRLSHNVCRDCSCLLTASISHQMETGTVLLLGTLTTSGINCTV